MSSVERRRGSAAFIGRVAPAAAPTAVVADRITALPRPVRAPAIEAAFMRLSHVPRHERAERFGAWLRALAKTPAGAARAKALAAAAEALEHLHLSERPQAFRGVFEQMRRLARADRAPALATLAQRLGDLPPGARGPSVDAILNAVGALRPADRTAPLHALIDALPAFVRGLRGMLSSEIIHASSADARAHAAVLERTLHRLGALEMQETEQITTYDLAAARAERLPPAESLTEARIYALADLPPYALASRANAELETIGKLVPGERYAAIAAAPSLLRQLTPGPGRDLAFAVALTACEGDRPAGPSLAMLAHEVELVSPSNAHSVAQRLKAILDALPAGERDEASRILTRKLGGAGTGGA